MIGALQDFTVLQNFCGNGCRIQDFQKSYPAGPVENGSFTAAWLLPRVILRPQHRIHLGCGADGFHAMQSRRRAVIESFSRVKDASSGMVTEQQRMPVEPLSHSAFEWLHTPFDVREIRVVVP
jgi:hypothetical protein